MMSALFLGPICSAKDGDKFGFNKMAQVFTTVLSALLHTTATTDRKQG
jgi:hypothetical protein